MAKKSVMEEFPLNEELYALEGEDVEWSFRIRTKYSFVMCENAIVYLLKDNPVVFKKPGMFLSLILRLARYGKIRKVLSHRRNNLTYNLYDFIINLLKNLPSLFTNRVSKISNNRMPK